MTGQPHLKGASNSIYGPNVGERHLHGNKLHGASLPILRVWARKCSWVQAAIDRVLIQRGCTEVDWHVQTRVVAGYAVAVAVHPLAEKIRKLVEGLHIRIVWLPVSKGAIQR